MLGHWDIIVFHLINRTLTNPSLDILMPLLTIFGSGEFVFALAVLLIIVGKKEMALAGILLLAGLTVTYFAVDALKAAFAVPRPFVSLPDVRLLVSQGSGYSFPSGHAVTAFMAATIASKFFNNRAVWVAFSSAVAFSRVYVGAHYASDAAAGAVIGIIIGYCLVKAANRIRIGRIL